MASDWKKKESFGSATIQIGAVAALLGLGMWFFYMRSSTKREVGEALLATRNIAMRDNPADINAALKKLDEIFKKDSSAPDALALEAELNTELWMIHRVPGSDAKAKDFLARAESAGSKSGDRYGTHALLMILDGKPKDAQDFVEELRKQGASSPKLYYAQAVALRQEGMLKLARGAFTSAMDKAWKDPQYADAYAESLLEDGLTLQALDAFNKGLGANSDHFRSRLGTALGRIYRKDHIREADDAVKEILGRDAELSPGIKARALAVRAELANYEQRYDDAINDAESALKLNPDDAWALLAKARALGLKKDPGAAAAFDAAVAKNKTAPVFYWDGAAVLQQAGNLDAALALLDKYEGIFKKVKYSGADGKEESHLDRDDRYWIARGNVLQAANKYDDAMAAYDKAVAAKAVNLVRAHYSRASLFLAKKDYDNALRSLEPITPPDGTGALPEAYSALGEVLFQKKEYAAGCQSFAFALTKMKTQQVPREQLNTVLVDIEKRLVSLGQPAMSKAWAKEAKTLIE